MSAAAGTPARTLSLRRFLLVGILVPVALLVAANSVVLYLQALEAADTAYDRTLLASAKAIGELLEVVAVDGQPQLRSTLPYSALEAFEADNRSRMFFRVAGFAGEMVSGFEDLPPPQPGPDATGVYAALVHFYDDAYRGESVRMAVLLQPVAGAGGQGMATIQVAETLELRHTLARHLLVSTLWHQGLFIALVAGVVVLVVQRATFPVRALSQRLRERPETDLQPLPTGGVPRELQPMVEASNQLMQRLALLLDHQKRFVRDASHQLRTPLAVLKTQLQSARRGDVAPDQALSEMTVTVARATDLANQLLALAKVEQLRQQATEAGTPIAAWDRVLREVALDVSPLIADAQLDFEIDTAPARVRAHDWALRELARNLLHNAVKFSPPGGRLRVRLERLGVARGRLTVSDSGPGIGRELRERLFQPFAAAPGGASAAAGSGLGLAICDGIVRSLGGRITLTNRPGSGLDAVVELPLVDEQPKVVDTPAAGGAGQ